MDFIKHDGNPNHKDQSGKETQRVGRNMWRDISAEEQRQRVVNQVNKQ